MLKQSKELEAKSFGLIASLEPTSVANPRIWALPPIANSRTLALPKEKAHQSLTTLRKKLVKIGAKVVSHGRHVTFQLAEVVIPRRLFAEILQMIDGLRPKSAPT